MEPLSTAPAAAATENRSYVAAPESELVARHAATKLRNALRLNAEFSTITGAAALVAAAPIADLLGRDEVWLVRLVGGGLLGFAALAFFYSGTRTSMLYRQARDVTAADAAGVVATLVGISLGWFSTGGAITMAALAAIVSGLAARQWQTRRRLSAAMSATSFELDESPPIEVVRSTRSASAAPSELWPVMTDHELYARLALNLRSAQGLTPNGPGLQRTCTDTAGRSWSETCTLWDEGRRFDIDVDTSDYPYPLSIMQGRWHVEPHGGGSQMTMTFAFQPEPGLRGRVFAPLMHVLFPPILRRIFRGWERAVS